jgi:hypothetical protein
LSVAALISRLLVLEDNSACRIVKGKSGNCAGFYVKLGALTSQEKGLSVDDIVAQ